MLTHFSALFTDHTRPGLPGTRPPFIASGKCKADWEGKNYRAPSDANDT
jgi:hypothetical protein